LASVYIKRVEIYGFKSFPYKTIVELHPGITAIVGPNGAGKSNLLDAIKWVLGEGSPKRLRVKEMSDLIFSGDHGRKVDFAEVKLVLAHEPPVLEKFKDLSEISIVRRFYRDGEGEFFINQKPCRLRDIQLLFLELGISNQGYSIIDQGDITKFIELSAKERRVFLEDLAGVSKIKFAEAEVAKNIEKTEFNLIRIKDLILEIERQYLALKEQAERAQKYLEIKGRYLILSLALNEERAKRVGTELSEVRQKIKSLEEKKASLEREIERLEDLEKEEQITMSELTLKLKSLQGEKANLEAELNRLNQSLNNLLREEADLKARMERERIRLSHEEERTKKVEAEEGTIQNELSKLNQQKDELQRQKDEKNRALAEGRKELEAKKVELAKLDASWQELLRKRDRLDEKKALIESQIKSFEKELARLKEDLLTLEERDSSSTESLAKLREERRGLEEALQRIRQEINLLKNKQDEVSSNLSSLKEEMILVSSHAQRLVKNIEFLDSLLKKEGKPGKIDLPPERILGYRFKDLSTEDIKVLEFVLGDRLKAIIVKEIDEIRNLAKSSEENLIFILEEELKRYDFSLFKHHKDTGLIISPDGFLYLMKKEKRGLFSLIKEREELSAELKVWQEKEKELKERQKSLNYEKEAVSNEIKKLEDKARELEKRLNALLSMERELEKEALKMEERRLRLSEERQKLEEMHRGALSEMGIINQELEEIQAKLITLEKQIKDKKREVESFEKEFFSLRKSLESLEKDLLQFNTRIAYLNDRLKALKEEKQRALSAIKSSKFNLERHEREALIVLESLKTLKEKRFKLEKDLEGIKLTLQELEGKREEHASRIKELQDQRKTHEKMVHKLTVEIHNASLREKELELLLAKLKDEIRSLKESLSFDGLNSGSLLPLTFDSPFDLAEEVSRLREELKKFGDVNLHSIKEFEAVEKRYKELLSHKEDLEASLAKLKEVLRELNGTARSKLVETLEKVNEKAREIFSELFPSAQVELALVGEDPLTAGLEVRIRIPNKNVKSINMLSGGEKALCVIGFLLSFYLVHPSPFLILDEVDAPLDEKNAIKFVKLLKRITKNSQVLLITHNPQVMKEVDLLIGVTMEEKGISKVLKLNLREFKEDHQLEATPRAKKAILP
jgi:chromosome segregation protein